MNELLLMHYKNLALANKKEVMVDVSGTIYNFPYTGSVQEINLWPGTYKLEVWGAQGGYRSGTSYGGKGGYSIGTLTLTDETTRLYIYSGGSGNTDGKAGGFNGGGKRGTYNGGGGASDIRIGQDSLYSRVIVAGGGGSDGASNKAGGYGGGTSGQAKTDGYGTGGFAGTQTGVSDSGWQTTTKPTSTTTQAGAYAGFGFGGNGITYSSGYGGAGGGGWYGGSGTYPDSSGDDDRGGGGGSGYVYNSSTAKNYPSGCLLTSKYYLTESSTKAGNTSFVKPAGGNETGHTGDGYCRITVISGYGKVQPKLYRAEYIEGFGNDYILTDIYPSSNIGRVKYKIKINESEVTKFYFGGRSDSTGNNGISLLQVLGKIRKDFSEVGSTGESVVSGRLYEDEMIPNSTDSFISNSPLAIFAVNSNNIIDGRMGIACIYYIKFYDNSENLIHNLQPYVTSDGEGCIKDLITKKVYYSNSGLIKAKYTFSSFININQTLTDPSQMITGDVNGDFIQWIRSNTHRVLAKKTGEGEVTYCELNDSDSNKYYDGASANLNGTQGDVFVKLPRFYYKATTGDKVTLCFSNKKLDNEYVEWNSDILIGAYEGYLDTNSNKLFSISGVVSTGGESLDNFNLYASNRGLGYQIVDWNIHCVIGSLYYAIYGDTDCQSSIGRGANTNNKENGLTNSLGMTDTIASNVNNVSSISFLGLENWWGNKFEFIGDALVDYDSLTITVNDIRNGGTRVLGFISQSKTPCSMMFGKDMDLLITPDSLSGGTAKGFCDQQILNSTGEKALRRSCNTYGLAGGVAYLAANIATTATNAATTARLAFRGKCIKETDVEKFKSLPIL